MKLKDALKAAILKHEPGKLSQFRLDKVWSAPPGIASSNYKPRSQKIQNGRNAKKP